MNLGESIYKYRTAKNMSQGDLADALDVSRQSVSKWENNSAVPELEKLVKMAELFGITLDEMVGKEAAPTPPPVYQIAPEKRPMPGHRLAGIILLSCGGAVFVAFTVIGFLMGSALLGLLLAFPLILNGTVCMLCKKYAGFACCWTNYILLFLVNFIIVTNLAGRAGVVGPMVISLILLALLVAWSLYKLHKGHFGDSRAKKIVWTVIFAVILVLHLFLLFPILRGGDSNITRITESDSYIESWSGTVYPQ